MANILLVEDSKFQRISTARDLQRAGHSITCAMDGDEALLLARAQPPDLILLDMLLPKMSGLDLLKALKADPATHAIPVIVLTGLSAKNAERLLIDGASSFFEKSLLAVENGSGKLHSAIADALKMKKDETSKQADPAPPRAQNA
jgi:CheY-like chemotaxis protein